MAAPLWQKGTVIRIEAATYNTRRYFIKVEGDEVFDFKAGQFVTLDLPIGEKPIDRWRSYSIASHPDGSNVIELLIVLLESGKGSTYIFNEIGEGSKFILRGPQGKFTLPEEMNRDLFFICTGTGIAPFRSMVHYIRLKNIPHGNIYLLYGSRTQKDLLYYDEMRALESEVPGLQYHPTLSREVWEGHSGYVHRLYEDICRKNNEGCKSPEKLREAHFYLCGWKAMIDDARKKIVDLGYSRKEIHFELYG